jgi:hypothetical protein
MNSLAYVIDSCVAIVVFVLSLLNEANPVKCSGYFGGTKENKRLRLTPELSGVFLGRND